jgi:hypothetical protein
MNPFNEIYAVQNRSVKHTCQYETYVYIDSNMSTEANMHALVNAFISQCTNMKSDVAENIEQLFNEVDGYFPQLQKADSWQ